MTTWKEEMKQEKLATEGSQIQSLDGKYAKRDSNVTTLKHIQIDDACHHIEAALDQLVGLRNDILGEDSAPSSREKAVQANVSLSEVLLQTPDRLHSLATEIEKTVSAIREIIL